MDTRTQRNLAKLSEDLNEVHSIMTRNIQEVLGQGEKLDREYVVGSALQGWTFTMQGMRMLHRQTV
jgi:vesicle transport protein SEC22